MSRNFNNLASQIGSGVVTSTANTGVTGLGLGSNNQTSVLNGLSTGNSPLSGLLGGAASLDPTALLGSTALDLIGFDLTKVVNDVKNALSVHLSCWRSTFTPDQTKIWVSQHIIPYFTALFDDLNNASSASQLENKLNKLAKDLYVNDKMFERLRLGNKNWKKCSRLSLDEPRKPFYKYMPKFQSLITLLNNDPNITVTQVTTSNAPLTFQYPTGFKWSEAKYWAQGVDYPVYQVKVKSGTSIGGSNSTADEPNDEASSTPSIAESALSIGVMLLGAALGNKLN